MSSCRIVPLLSEGFINEAETKTRREGVPKWYGDERHFCCRPLMNAEAERENAR